MRWKCRAAAILILCVPLTGCKDRGVVRTADPRRGSQLLSGFYGIEQNAWRWTAARFSVRLDTPAWASRIGAVLRLRFSIPDRLIRELGVISVAASIGGLPLAPESYTQPGDFIYVREVPSHRLRSESVRVDFFLDKALAPNSSDRRELGLIVASIALQPR